MTEQEKQRIRDLLVSMIGMLRTEAEATMRISAELAAGLGAVHELNPTFLEVLEQHRSEVSQMNDRVMRAELDRYDEMIRKVERGEFL